MAKKITTEEYIERAKNIHGVKYDYSEVVYKSMMDKVKVVCPKHGQFEILANNFIKKKPHGCPMCANEKKSLGVDVFIKRAKELHGDKYDYSKVVYKTMHDKVDIICPKHGIFSMMAQNHIKSSHPCGCPQCGIEKTRGTTEKFIEKASQIHHGWYDYSCVEYKDSSTPVKILCPKHGFFMQTPKVHLGGKGCKRCAHRYQTTEDIVERLKEVHGDKYDYSELEYKGLKERVKVICPKHGAWFPLLANHLYAQNGCPECGKQNNYSEEKFGEWLSSVYKGEIIRNDRSTLYDDNTKAYKEIDFLLPDINIAIEFNGEYWHEKREQEQIGYHQKKEELCKQHHLRLINVSFEEWFKNEEMAQQKVLEEIGLNNIR